MANRSAETERLPISVIILTLNEEKNIDACLRSVADWAGEILVVDSGSTDNTLQIAERYTSSVVHHPFENYSRQRNWSQANLPLNFDWVFHIDADERVTPELVHRLRQFFRNNQQPDSIAGLLVRRRIVFWGKHIRHGGLYPTYHCRIYRKGLGRCEDREYDQHFVVDGKIGKIEADLTEITAQSLFSWTERHNRWAQLEAKYLAHLDKKTGSTKNIESKLGGSPIERRRWLKASVYERSPLFLRAFLYFIIRYFARGGFLDGMPGLVYHVLHSFWFRFYIDACLYELNHDLDINKQAT